MLRSFVVGACLLAFVVACTTAESTPPIADPAPSPTTSSTLRATAPDPPTGTTDSAVTTTVTWRKEGVPPSGRVFHFAAGPITVELASDGRINYVNLQYHRDATAILAYTQCRQENYGPLGEEISSQVFGPERIIRSLTEIVADDIAAEQDCFTQTLG